jgi:DNA-binding MarR family transcriptional regulator
MNTETGYCYIVLFSNGFVKGGKSRDVLKRCKTHRATAAALGLSVKGAFYTEPHGDYHANEKRLLSALAEVSENRVGEFFRGVEKTAALEALGSLGYGLNTIEECYDKRWFIMAQDALVILAKDKDLTLEPKNVLLYLLSQLDFENFMHVPQVEIAEALGMDKSKVSKAIKLLTEKGILIRGPKQARSSSFRLNPNFGYKGNPSGKVYRTKDGRREFRVVDDEGYVVPPDGPEPGGTPGEEQP